ncbi:hypothetical protein [Yersinia rohdei]|uniref:hypothetical protein n=1 Tax=Yersinia rohdei TaxID=29485 RepID=UPI001643E1F0|nr:hypothetical protein [Yersinia rohdei]
MRNYCEPYHTWVKGLPKAFGVAGRQYLGLKGYVMQIKPLVGNSWFNAADPE